MGIYPTVSREVANVYGQFTGKAIDDEYVEGGNVDMERYLVSYNDMKVSYNDLKVSYNDLKVSCNEMKTERDELFEVLVSEWRREAESSNKDITEIIQSKSIPEATKRKCIERLKNGFAE